MGPLRSVLNVVSLLVTIGLAMADIVSITTEKE